MKLKVICATVIMAAALALPSTSSAAPPPPTQDSVVLTDGPAQIGTFFGFIVSELDATSGPSGENPSGEVDVGSFPVHSFGPVTCLAVSGNSATINFRDQGILAGQIVTVHVVDDNPDTISVLPLGQAPTDCSPPPPTNTQDPLSSGDITVVDAQPLPTSKDQCKNGGWEQLGFKNQGQCMAFVNHNS